MLGMDALGRDTLSRLMAGGRFLVERLAILAGVLTVAGLLLRRRLRKRGGGAWLTGRRLMLGIAAVLALSVLLEFALGVHQRGPARSGSACLGGWCSAQSAFRRFPRGAAC